jgi:hypothetical protein
VVVDSVMGKGVSLTQDKSIRHGLRLVQPTSATDRAVDWNPGPSLGKPDDQGHVITRQETSLRKEGIARWAVAWALTALHFHHGVGTKGVRLPGKTT